MFNPMKVKDYVTLGNILFGFGAIVACVHGQLDWACWLMIFAWVVDSIDGVVARLTGGGNQFGSVLDNTADLVAYCIAPSLIIYVVYTTGRIHGGAGWPIWAAFLLASLPTIFGCIRFARNNVKNIILPELHLGLPRTVYGLYIATLFASHVFQNPLVYNPSSFANPIFYAFGAIFIVVLSLLTFTLIPFCAKPLQGGGAWWFMIFSVYFFLITTLSSLLVGIIIGKVRIFIDALFINFTIYVWFQYWTIPFSRQRQAKQYVNKLIREWKHEQG